MDLDSKIEKAVKIQNLRELLNEDDSFFNEIQDRQKTEEVLAQWLCRVSLKEHFEKDTDLADIDYSRIDLEIVADKIKDAVLEYLHVKLPLDNEGNVHLSKKENWEVA